MGKFEEIINENVVNRLQEVLMDFFQQTLPPEVATRMSKNPKQYLLQQMTPVDVEGKFSFDNQAAKLRPDQLGQSGFGQRKMTHGVDESINEAATVDTIQQFAQAIGLNTLQPGVADQAVKRWPEFVEAVKTKLGWDYNIQYQPAPEQPAPEQPAPEQPAPEQPSSEQKPPPVNPIGKGLFRRGIEATGRSLKDIGGAAKDAYMKQEPYNANSNRNPFGNLGIDKIKNTPNQGKVDSKEIEERLGYIQSKIGSMGSDIQPKVKEIHDKLIDYWVKVKPALISYPEKNQEWKGYIQNQLTELEKYTGIQPGDATSGSNVSQQTTQPSTKETSDTTVRA